MRFLSDLEGMATQNSNATIRATDAFRRRGGTLRTKQAIAAGIHPRTLYQLRDSGEIEQVSRGVFRLAAVERSVDPDLLAVAARVPRGVICLTSALAVALQLVNFLGKSTVDEQLKSMGRDDVLIEPDLGNISAASFTLSKDAIRIGEEATRKLAHKLSRYSIAPEKYAEFRARQVADKAALGTVAEIRFEGLERTNPEVLRGLLNTRPNEPLSEETINADLRRIYGRGDFEGVSYRIIGDTGPRTMVVTPREKLWGPDYLRFGLGLASDFQGENQFNVLVQYRKTWLNSLGAEWLTEAQIGQDTHLLTEWYQPLNDKGVWFGALYGVVGQTTRGIFNNNVSNPEQIADYLIGSARAGVDLGATLGRVADFSRIEG